MKFTAPALLLGILLVLTSCASSTKDEAETIDAVLDGPTITVLDEAGGAVADAEVWIVDRLAIRADVAVVASRMTGDWVQTSVEIATEVRRTDADGKATFDVVPQSGVLVAARRGALFGGVELKGLGGRELEIRLRPRPTYRVRVVDADGEPAVGVPMSLAIPRGDELERLAATSFTDAEGLAVMYEPPPAAYTARRGTDRGTARVAVARIATRDVLQVAVDPVGTAELQLPPTGSVALVASHPDFPVDHWRGVIQLFAAADGSRSELTLAASLDDSRVVVDHVEVGVPLRAVIVLGEKGDEVRRLIGKHAELLKPVENPGEQTSRILLLDGGGLFEGRVIDEEGEPIAGAALDLVVRDDPGTTWTLITDDDGGFRWLLTSSREPLDGAVVELKATRRRGTVTIPRGSPAAGLVSLGTVELLLP